MLKYLVVSPVKDEERHIGHTLRSMVTQTVKPVRWMIVDDGSSDATPELVESVLRESPWIQLLRLPKGPRHPGAGIVRAFDRGYEAARDLDHDVVVKLDCDLGFAPDYFEQLLAEFEADPKLGIASGVYWEPRRRALWDGRTGVEWVEIRMPHYHAAGPSKVLRRECYAQIGGFVAARGWDTVDEIRAMMCGWRTGHFRQLRLQHWKPEGTSIGWRKTRVMHGSVYYLTGGGTLFFVLKVLHCMKSRPFLLGGLAMLWGYLEAVVRRRPRLVTRDECRFYRSLLNDRLLERLRRRGGELQSTL